MIILRLLLLLTNLHLKLLRPGADKLLSTQRVKVFYCGVKKSRCGKQIKKMR